MRPSVQLRVQMRAAISSEIADRTKAHQASIASLRSTRRRLTQVDSPAAASPNPLVLLAHGDSWFDYPLNGNDLSISSTDVIAQLQSMGGNPPRILNVSHHGDATEDEMSLPKQQRLIAALQDPSNWLDSALPDAILFSGGGDDIAGDQFCIFLDYAGGPDGLDPARFTAALGGVRGDYMDLFAFRNRFASGVPIFAHSYDFPIPNGTHPACVGPWLKPSLDFCGYNVAEGTEIVHAALAQFKGMLADLAQDPANNFVLVDTQGSLQASDWANELHPYPAGFKTIAGKFLAALAAKFPGRTAAV